MSRRKIIFSSEPGKSVPRANNLAVVTAINTVTHQRAELFGDAAAQFNGQVGDTASRIHAEGCNDGPGGADIDAFGAGTAMFSAWLIYRQWEVRVNLTEEEPAAGFPVDQVGMLADPAKTSFLCQRFFQYRC